MFGAQEMNVYSNTNIEQAMISLNPFFAFTHNHIDC